jgi:hypothetical protein
MMMIERLLIAFPSVWLISLNINASIAGGKSEKALDAQLMQYSR